LSKWDEPNLEVVFVAETEKLKHIVRGTQVKPRIALNSTFMCPSCGKEVTFDSSSSELLEYFNHKDGSSDCFANDAASDEHRLASEISLQAIYNRLARDTDKPVEIDTERWVGEQPDFIFADVRVTSPAYITAEIFYKARKFNLRDRFEVLSQNDYQTYLIIHTEGCHDPDEINRYMSRVSPLNVGYFDPHSMEIVLGDLFSWEQINFNKKNKVPNYLIFSG
jgi:hypothetical protein